MKEQRHRVTWRWLPLGAVIAAGPAGTPPSARQEGNLPIADYRKNRITVFSAAGEFLGKVAVESRRPQVNRMTS